MLLHTYQKEPVNKNIITLLKHNNSSSDGIAKTNNDNAPPISQNTDIFEERAAIIEYDGGIPRAWAELILKAQVMEKPLSLSLEKWTQVQFALRIILPHLCKIAECDWSIELIFGCCFNEPDKGFNSTGIISGLVMLLSKEARIISVTKEVIYFKQTQYSIELPFVRKHHDADVKRILITELT